MRPARIPEQSETAEYFLLEACQLFAFLHE